MGENNVEYQNEDIDSKLIILFYNINGKEMQKIRGRIQKVFTSIIKKDFDVCQMLARISTTAVSRSRCRDKSAHIPVSFPAYLPRISTDFPSTLPTNLSAGLSKYALNFWVVLKMIKWN